MDRTLKEFTNMKPFILLTNDDGIHAPGLKHLWQTVHDFTDTAIIAPHVEKSGCGLSITCSKPLMVRPVSWDGGTPAWSLNGTPSDCVKMACNVILDKRPQMVLSGINRGSNAGRTVLYSGTMGGAIEATFKEIPGIAFSFSDFEPPSVSATKEYISLIIKYFMAHPLPPGVCLNVTFPHMSPKGIKGVRLAKQGRGYWREAPEHRINPEGVPYYWLGGKWAAYEEDPESDVALLTQGYITIAPLQIEQLTHHETLAGRKESLEQIFKSIENYSSTPVE